MKLGELSFKLHGKGHKKSVLILIRKIRGFLKIIDFGPFFSSQLETPQKLTADAQKHSVYDVFHLFKQRLPENDPFQRIAPMV